MPDYPIDVTMNDRQRSAWESLGAEFAPWAQHKNPEWISCACGQEAELGDPSIVKPWACWRAECAVEPQPEPAAARSTAADPSPIELSRNDDGRLSFVWRTSEWVAAGWLAAPPAPLSVVALSVVALSGAVTNDTMREVKIGTLLSEVRRTLARAEVIERARLEIVGWSAERVRQADDVGGLNEWADGSRSKRGRPSQPDDHLARLSAVLLDELRAGRGANKRAWLRLKKELGNYPEGTMKTQLVTAERRGFLTPGARGGQGRTAGEAMLRSVAHIHDAARGRRVEAVSRHFGIASQTAEEMVRDAAAVGLLTRGRNK